MHALSSICFIRKTFNARDETWIAFSPSISCQSTWKFICFLTEHQQTIFPLQFLLIVLSVKVTYISNRSQAWVAYSQRRASGGSHAHLVIESDPYEKFSCANFPSSCYKNSIYSGKLSLHVPPVYNWLQPTPLGSVYTTISYRIYN